MKKRMRKAVAIAATAAMVGSLPAGAVTAQAADDDITIGVSIWSSTDVLGSQSKKIIDKAADALGVNVMYVDQGHVSEQVTASVEQLCAAGCNGIVICNSADSEMTSAIQTCDANQVYLTQFYRIISEENSPEVYQTACNSQYYLGAVHEDEVTNGYTLVNLLLENGDRNIGLEAWTVGDATFQQRWTGYKQAVDEWNEANPDDQATITEPVYANTSSEEGAAAALSLYNSNPDMDALMLQAAAVTRLLVPSVLWQTKDLQERSTLFPQTSLMTLASSLNQAECLLNQADTSATRYMHSLSHITQSKATM